MPRYLFTNMINSTLKHIEEQIGLKLQLCDYFTGIRESNGDKYLNVILPKRTSEAKEYTQLVRFSDRFKTIRVEPNGLNRVAIFFNGARHKQGRDITNGQLETTKPALHIDNITAPYLD